jgi:4-deoxy-L-threo-5-hexosulose-uronate ketol-isomerase
MEIRQATNPIDLKNYNTEELRSQYLANELFQSEQITLVYTHHDRVVIGGALSIEEALVLDAGDYLRTEYFLERLEAGFINISGEAVITVDGTEYKLQPKDALYVGMGNKKVTIRSADGVQSCQLMMEMTILKPNNIWNTMPAHLQAKCVKSSSSML